MPNIKSIKCKAFAKINLFLNVFDKTKDNLHNLNSLVCFISLYAFSLYSYVVIFESIYTFYHVNAN